MRNASTPGSPVPASGNTYSPSVPISLYRQVATELQATQTQLETLQAENRHLTEQNQQLRLEIERVVQSALQLREVANSYQAVDSLPESVDRFSSLELHFETPPAPEPEPLPRRQPPRAVAPEPEPLPRSKAPRETPPEPAALAEQLLTGQESQLRKAAPPDKAEVGGWWLVLVIFLIVVTAFGTGFLIVRPLLPSR